MSRLQVLLAAAFCGLSAVVCAAPPASPSPGMSATMWSELAGAAKELANKGNPFLDEGVSGPGTEGAPATPNAASANQDRRLLGTWAARSAQAYASFTFRKTGFEIDFNGKRTTGTWQTHDQILEIFPTGGNRASFTYELKERFLILANGDTVLERVDAENASGQNQPNGQNGWGGGQNNHNGAGGWGGNSGGNLTGAALGAFIEGSWLMNTPNGIINWVFHQGTFETYVSGNLVMRGNCQINGRMLKFNTTYRANPSLPDLVLGVQVTPIGQDSMRWGEDNSTDTLMLTRSGGAASAGNMQLNGRWWLSTRQNGRVSVITYTFMGSMLAIYHNGSLMNTANFTVTAPGQLQIVWRDGATAGQTENWNFHVDGQYLRLSNMRGSRGANLSVVLRR